MTTRRGRIRRLRAAAKFIERNWRLPALSSRSWDNLPNPKASAANPYVPTNGPAVGDLFDLFNFGNSGGS